MPIETIAGEPFNIRFDGPADAPVLMLSNSLGTNLSMWDPQIPEWSKRFRVLRYDSRGHGLSVATDRAFSIDTLGKDALAILDHFGIAQAHWCGVSKGGMVGQWLATNARERMGRLVLANTAAHMGPPSLWDDRIAMARSKGMDALVQGVLARWFSPRFREAEPATVARVGTMLTTTPAIGYATCCAAIRDMDQREAIRSVSNPVLVIIGTVDPATPPAAGHLIAQAIPGARTVELDAAHLSNLEQPEAFTTAVQDFLSE
ncbi:3-oxoadipate enol-lactonase [Bosea sp. (in: a-proteobacteria)]|uniref:3-oxoadipate enol-lactonase n=1 Tax=Bosea sp. (in: a-proteobacteria) TaxID=1871050 RepID=UPI002736AF3A|nr:3-oxoadipate enol-lactonase [Bosea sp. (in: a-proteobacteria)]MDP3410871.1 3-oxoadipate enol-lactonase [Bosea sp. (in: a-proteobacteria)]